MGSNGPGNCREFLRQIHHAIMNPLTVVVGYAQLLESRPELDEDVRYRISKILEQAQACTTSVEELMKEADQDSHAPQAETPPEENQSDAAFTRSKVLVVDDEPVIQRLVMRALQSEYSVTPAATPQEAMPLVRERHFDALLLDVHLKGGNDGLDFHRRLVRIRPDLVPRTVFLTGGVVSTEDSAYIERSGAATLNKPFDIAALRGEPWPRRSRESSSRAQAFGQNTYPVQ